jgi:photosystem II stability/assembly factor-like uncharacterized protein
MDYGVSFAPTGWPFSSASSVVVDPSSSKTIFVVAGQPLTLSVSRDGGSSWAASNLPHAYASTMVSIHPRYSQIVLAALELQAPSIWRSTDGGKNFQQVSTLPSCSAGVYASALRFNPQAGTPYLAIAYCGGVYVSTDYGSNWSSVTGNAISAAMSDAQWSSGTLFVASYGQGVLRSSAALQ